MRSIAAESSTQSKSSGSGGSWLPGYPTPELMHAKSCASLEACQDSRLNLFVAAAHTPPCVILAGPLCHQGLIPGGGEFVGSDRAHVYLSGSRISDVGYQSGLRGKYSIQLTIASKEAVEDGLIFFKNRSGGIMTIDVIPPEYIILVENTDNKQSLWSRVSATGLEEGGTPKHEEEKGSPTVTGAPEPAAKAIHAQYLRECRMCGVDTHRSALISSKG